MARDPSARSPREYFCAEILRLPPSTTEPDHYTLLGLPFFEHDHGTIVRAAMARIRLLESCQADTRPGHQKALHDLLTEVRRAQIELLDVNRRKAYDANLIGDEEDPQTEDEEVDDEIELRPGTMVVDRYRILGERRRGGFGIVYNALDKNMRTRVELSVLRSRLSQARRSRRRAERAARSAAGLDHPNILRVDEVGDADGLLFVRTRQIEGKNLVETIEATPRMRLDPVQVRDIMRQIAMALAHAHEREELHGDLRPHSVFVTAEGRVVVADFAMMRAVLDELGSPPPRTRAPENQNSAAADLFSLGCLAYQMLAGMPPFTADTSHFVPRPLQDDVPEDLEVLVMRLLARDPERRPRSAADVAERLVPEASKKRLPMLLAVAAVLLVVLVVAIVSGAGGDGSEGTGDVRAQAWELIADERFDEAIAKLRDERKAHPEDAGLMPALAGALDRKAATLSDDPWEAQLLLQEAQGLAPQEERVKEIARIKAIALAHLDRIPVMLPAYTSTVDVRAEVGERFGGKVEIGGQEVPAENGIARRMLQLFDGPHEIAFVLTDRVGNRREGTVKTIVDSVPPKIRIISPKDGELFSRGGIRVKVVVEDVNLPDTLTIRGRRVAINDGEASNIFNLADGKHVVEAVVKDRAGHEARATSTITIDSSVPEFTLVAARLASKDGRAVVRGAVATAGAKLRVDGKLVAIKKDGSFSAPVKVEADRRVPVEVEGPTGIRKKRSVWVTIDSVPPRLSVDWKRRDRNGVLLYGKREMDGRGLRLRVRAKDKTTVRFVPSEGRIENGVWILDAHEGARSVGLKAIDEAGNQVQLTIDIEGHRSTPTLIVKNNTEDYTNDDNAVLDIEADGTLYVQGKVRGPGRVKLPLAEGRVTLLVSAVDRFGNESRWSRDIVVDRTPPEVTLHGDLDRGIGRQELRFDANEELASVTCFGKTQDVHAKTVRIMADLKPGRRRLTLVARDLAGNVTKITVPLRVVNKVLVLDGKSALAVSMKAVRLERFTIECWVRGSAAGRLRVRRSAIVTRSARTSGFGLFWSRADKGLPYAAVVLRGPGFTVLPARKAWRWERWTHLALSFDGARVRFFVNGSLHHQVATRNPLLTGAEPLLIGAQPDSRKRPSAMFNGRIDELRLSSIARYTRAFSPKRYHKDDDNTVLLLRFDTMVGDRFADTSGNNLHAWRIGAPTLVEENR